MGQDAEQLAAFGAKIQMLKNFGSKGADSACIIIFQIAWHLTLTGILLCAHLHKWLPKYLYKSNEESGFQGTILSYKRTHISVYKNDI